NGYTVYLTRTDEGCAAGAAKGADGLRNCLEHRVTVAYEYGATVMVSLHLNASNEHTASGAEVYIPNRKRNSAVSDQASRVASFVRSELKALGLKDQGAKTRDAEDGSDYYFIIRDGKAKGIPVLIIENAFLDFDADYEAFLSTEEKLRALGEADARGIIRALQ
ncbi:MAG: N-acetylmuramoyl-L-alanine amidase, partial [Lachnospiraceae bacterium]|nr:N-acetylmuramoyl-L-alanine amidase [Lachnospiraceae bacterium]